MGRGRKKKSRKSSSILSTVPIAASSPPNASTVEDNFDLEKELDEIKKYRDDNKKRMVNQARIDMMKFDVEALVSKEYKVDILNSEELTMLGLHKIGNKVEFIQEKSHFKESVASDTSNDTTKLKRGRKKKEDKPVAVKISNENTSKLKEDQKKNEDKVGFKVPALPGIRNIGANAHCSTDDTSNNSKDGFKGFIPRSTENSQNTCLQHEFLLNGHGSYISDKFKTPYRGGKEMSKFAVVTPGPSMNKSINILRKPGPGEVAVSLTGSPLLVAPDLGVTAMTQLTLPTADGKVMSILPRGSITDENIPPLEHRTQIELRKIRAYIDQIIEN